MSVCLGEDRTCLGGDCSCPSVLERTGQVLEEFIEKKKGYSIDP